MGQILTGTFEADGNDVTLDLGFIPSYLKLFNADASDGDVMMIEWFAQAGETNEFHTVRMKNDGDNTDESPIFTESGEIEEEVESDDVETSDPVQPVGKRGVKIDGGWMDDGDQIYYFAVMADRDQDFGDCADW
ncbi:MAG: hypothetical protein ACLFUL_06305 [Desulfobacteraceae bacterium]